MKIVGYIITALLGLIFGVSVAILFIVKHVRRAVRKKAHCEYFDGIEESDRKKIDEYVTTEQKKYKAYKKGKIFKAILGFNKKKDEDFPIEYFTLIKSVASVFNPESETPLLELTEKQVFEFGHTVTARIEQILDALGVPTLYNINLSTAINSVKLVNGLLNNVIVTAVSSSADKVLRVINCINPYFWIKKTVKVITKELITREVVYASVEIIAKEFANLYFNAEKSEISLENQQ